MKQWLRRLRGALGMGLTWAAGWAPIGAAAGAVLHVVLPGSPLSLGVVIGLNAATFAALGFLGGTGFAGILGLGEGRRRFDQLSLPRFAAWGAVGGVLLGGLGAAVGLWGGGVGLLGAAMVGAATLLGGASAAGTLVVARSVDDSRLLRSGADVADMSVTQTERDHLLGGGI
jgi:hypothetical protein